MEQKLCQDLNYNPSHPLLILEQLFEKDRVNDSIFSFSVHKTILVMAIYKEQKFVSWGSGGWSSKIKTFSIL